MLKRILLSLLLSALAIPAVALVSLDNGVTGILPVANGGLGGSNGGPLSNLSTIQPPLFKASISSTTATSTVYSLPKGGGATVTYNASGLASAQFNSGIAYPLVTANTAVFGVYGTTGLGPRSNGFPAYYMAENHLNDTQPDQFYIAFKHTGSQFDLIHYGAGQTYNVYVDGQYVDSYAPALTSGTAQAGGVNTITLAAGSSSTNGFYNQAYVKITGGTGAGQVGLITGYVGSTKVATVATNWGTSPDNTSTYVVTQSFSGQSINGLDGSINYINVNFGRIATRDILICTTGFYGVNIGPSDGLAPSSPFGATRMVFVGDSFIQNTGAPMNGPFMSTLISMLQGTQEYNLGQGGTGWYTPPTTVSNGSVNFADRIAPPAESWQYNLGSPSAGNYTISVTYGGSTLTTGNIAFNASVSTISTAVQGLANLPANSVVVGGIANSAFPQGVFILLHGVPGATLSINTSGLTGGLLTFSPWAGEVAAVVPKDGSGNALPFILYVQGSGNDIGQGYTATQVQANATYAAQQIVKRFPTAIPIYSGAISLNSGTTGSGQVSINNGIESAAGLLPKINGNVPYIETYPGGVGGVGWIEGGGSVASPSANTTDVFSSVILAGHPTGNGHAYLAGRVSQNIKSLLGAQ